LKRRGGGDISKSNVFDIGFDIADSRYAYAATSEGLYRTDDIGGKWRRVQSGALDGDAYSVVSFVQDPRNAQRKYVALYTSNKGQILKSRGEDFYEVYSTTDNGDRVSGIWVDPLDSSHLYAGTKGGLFLRSNDFGESWRVGGEFEDALRTIKIAPSDTGIMYLILGSSGLFKSTNRGDSWKDISPQFQRGFIINQLIIDSRNEKFLYIASNEGLLRSENGGATFYKIDLLLVEDSTQVSAVALDAREPNVVYIGINNQVHKSNDGGKSWQVKTLDTKRKISVIRVKPDDSRIIFVGVKQ